jgi:Rad3-related DNA helicase
MGRFRFREHLSREGRPASSALLAFYQDGKAYEKIMAEFKSLGVAIHETFLAPAARKEIDVPTKCKEESLIALREAHHLKAPFTRAGQRAFDQLYATEVSL